MYDYTSNSWLDASEAFSRPGTYERALLTGPGGVRVRVRIMPRGHGGLSIDAESAGDVSVWRALGVHLAVRHLTLVVEVLAGREGPVALEEVATLLTEIDGVVAREVLEALGPLLPGAGSSLDRRGGAPK